MGHDCIQSDNIERLINWVDGNGKPGLRQDVALIQNKLEDINNNMTKLTNNVSALVEYVTKEKTISELREKKLLSARQRTTIIISAIVGFSGVVIKLMDVLK